LPEEVAAVTETLLRGDWEDEREDVYSTLWDFAGQSVYYVTHPLFLTVRAIYCLFYDLNLNPHGIAKPLVKQGVYKKTVESFNLKTNLDYLDFWMMSVGSLASSHYESSDIGPESEVLPAKIPPVFLVCTHADSPYDDRDPKELAFEILGWLKSKPCGAQLSGVFVVDNTKSGTESECSGVTHLRQEILNVAKALPHINEAIPIKWLKFDKILNALKENGRRYISLESAKDIASTICNIDEDKEFQTLMNYLHDVRSLIHFDDSLELNKLVVLDPQWLIDVFKKVITVQPAYNCTETNFVKLWEKLEREGILDGTLLDHVWGRLFSSKETFESLVAILENFSLLCPLPSDSVNKQTNYLVPSMLKTHPPKKVFELVKSVKIPSMFIKFETGQVPAGLFPRLVMQFFQWGKESFLRPGQPQLFQSFARFFTSEHEDWSVIFVCHTSSIEVAVHTGNPSLQLAEDFSSKMTLQTHIPCDSPGSSCARVVRRQLGLMLECMRSEFHWLRNMKYYMSFLCPVCCNGGAMDYCLSHNVQGCKDEHCLHFWSESELCNVKQTIICNNSAFAQNTRVPVLQFAYWSVPAEQQLAADEQDDRLLPVAGNGERALALPVGVLESLKSCDPKDIVSKLKESLELNQDAIEQPDPTTKRLIRYLARQAKSSARLDVVEHLREILPAGTTGPLLPEDLDIRGIPFRQGKELTIALCGGDEWKLVADNLGLNSDQIRFLDNRTRNPADAVLGCIANERYLSVGKLYDVLNDCELPVLADKL